MSIRIFRLLVDSKPNLCTNIIRIVITKVERLNGGLLKDLESERVWSAAK